MTLRVKNLTRSSWTDVFGEYRESSVYIKLKRYFNDGGYNEWNK